MDPIPALAPPDAPVRPVAAPPAGPAAPLPGRAGLLLGSPRQVLARIQRGDPLGLGPRAARAVARRGLVVDPDRLHLRVLARVAWAASRRGALHSLDAFLEEQVQRALDGLLRDEARAVQAGEVVEQGDGATLFDNPQEDYTQRLLSAIPRRSLL